MKNFGDRIKEERINRQITQKEAAEHLHMSESTLSRYENGKREVSMEVVKEFSDYYEIPIHELIDEKESVGKTDSPAEIKQQNIVDAFFESKHGQIIFYMIIMVLSVLTSTSGFGMLFALYGLYYAQKNKFSKFIIVLTIVYIAWYIEKFILFYYGIELLPSNTGYTDM